MKYELRAKLSQMPGNSAKDLPMNLADFPFSGRHALNFSLLLDKNKLLPVRWKKPIYKSYNSKEILEMYKLKCIEECVIF